MDFCKRSIKAVPRPRLPSLRGCLKESLHLVGASTSVSFDLFVLSCIILESGMNRPADIAAQNVFSLGHQEFYETLSYHPLSPEYVDRLRALLPKTAWVLHRDQIWVHARHLVTDSSTATPVIQGFKIHVSAAPMYALQVLDLIVPACVQRGINFKIAGDSSLLHLLNSKLQERGYSGKFMTLYPPDQTSFEDLIEDLYQRTKNHPAKGAYILSDQRYKDSKILFYRYGGFHPPYQLNVDGTQTSYLLSPQGEYVPDQRLPYFHLPDWASDPFGEADDVEYQGNTALNDRYLVEGALAFSNAGGVYYGTDTSTQQSVILKEARPLTNCWSVGERFWDAVYLLEREYKVLRRLQDLDCVPRPIELFQDWEHNFLVEERVDGLRFDAYWAQEDVILAPYIRRQGSIERFLPKFKSIAEALLQMITAVHERGILLGDLSPRNILINPETLQMWLIDFESAVFVDDDSEVLTYSTRWGTAGFVHPTRASRSQLLPEDDLYAVAMTLYSCVVPVNQLFALNPDAESIFLDKFIELGVPVEIKDMISSLLRGAVTEAQEIVTHWKI
jgi:hypothetical protein